MYILQTRNIFIMKFAQASDLGTMLDSNVSLVHVFLGIFCFILIDTLIKAENGFLFWDQS